MSDATGAAGVPGSSERAARGPVLRKGVGPSPTGWFDPRGRAIGSWAFAVNRITGLGLVFYLYLHLGVLSLLLAGESAWNDFLEIATSTVFLGLDGVRVALVGSGVVPNRQMALFWAGTMIGTIVLVYGAVHIIGSG